MTRAWWEKSAYAVEQKAEELIKNDFGDRIIVWSEMSKLLLTKGIPAKYLQNYCSRSLCYVSDILDLFNAEIKECLTLGNNAVIKPAEFDAYMQETSHAIQDHRVLNHDSSVKREDIRKIFEKAWIDV
ncbi:MAG: hypothetical protein ABH956_00520 [Candidatus Nealsonbacteria bacterium]